MYKCALQLGGIQVNQNFRIPTEYNLTPYRRAELAILNLIKQPQEINFLRSVDTLAFDNMGQSSAKILSIFDIIL